MQVNVLGRLYTVQPHCNCEWEAHQEVVRKAEEAHKQDQIKQMFSVSKLGERFNECRFESYIDRGGNESALKVAKDYAESFESWEGSSIYLWGKPGNGKTHLAAAITHRLEESKKSVVFQSVPELLDRIRSTFNQRSKETQEQIIWALMNCDLLVLDDIGSEKVSEWVAQELFRIIDGRYRAKKPILFTSNLKITQLQERFEQPHGDRIADRILEMAVPVENKATSYRLETAKRRYETLRGESNG